MVPLFHLLLLTCGALLTLLMALGLRLQRRAGHPRQGKWLHHLLYFVVTALVGLLAGLRGWARQPFWPLLLALTLLLLMPLTRPGKGNHWQLAIMCALGYSWAAWQVW